MEFTFYGHACFQIKVQDKVLLFDPFISGNELAANIDISDIRADYILISHGHFDHIADIDEIYKNTEAVIIANFEIITWLQKKDIKKGHPMNPGGKWKFDFGTVKMVNAVHSSSLPDGSYGGQPAGFVIETSEKTFYYSGDTALHQDMRQIEESYFIDFAILPIGDNFTMGIEDAVKAATYVDTNKIIGVHYDTFPYIEIDHSIAKKVAKKENKELLLVGIGETVKI